jgi:hypothetical protein
MKARRFILLIAAVALIAVMTPCVFAADDDAITVYVTVSDNGEFVTGDDGTVMAHVPVEVSYFDLEEYGLSEYYRYEAAPFSEGGEYISDRIIEQPTLLHLYIRLLEQYYAGRKLTPADMHSDIIDITGSATHLFMKSFWGHNYNLMYFVDHAFPLQSKGWGATCDYIILYDGSEIDLAMFTDMSFNVTGAFTCFDDTEETVTVGEELTLTLLGTETKDGGGEINAPVPNEPIRVSSDHGVTWDTSYGKTGSDGKITLGFDKAGTYYISAGPLMVNYPSESGMPDTAPPISVITVKPAQGAVAVQSVEIIGSSIEAPDKSKELKSTAECIGEGVETSAGIVWREDNKRYSGKPRAGHTYSADITIRPLSGYTLTADTKVTMDGAELSVIRAGADGTITVRKEYDPLPEDQDDQGSGSEGHGEGGSDGQKDDGEEINKQEKSRSRAAAVITRITSRVRKTAVRILSKVIRISKIIKRSKLLRLLRRKK